MPDRSAMDADCWVGGRKPPSSHGCRVALELRTPHRLVKSGHLLFQNRSHIKGFWIIMGAGYDLDNSPDAIYADPCMHCQRRQP